LPKSFHELRLLLRHPARGEEGGILLGIYVMIAIMGIMSGIVVQEWTVVARRDNEQELIFIQEQYAAAILNYEAAKGGTQPLTDLETLFKESGEGGARFIRKAFVDPMTKNATLEDWCLLKLGPAGRVLSSCSQEGQTNPFSQGSKFQLGEKGQSAADTRAANPRASRRRGNNPGRAITPGANTIVGVHSKSTERAFNTLKRQEETYNRWYYTREDYKQDVAARAIPGLSAAQGPGLGNNPTQGTQPGRGNTTSQGRPTGRKKPNRR